MSSVAAILVVLAAVSCGVLATLAARRLAAIEIRRLHHEVGAVVFLQLGVVFAVLLAFAFNETWTEYNAASEAIAREVGAMHGTALIATTLPPGQARAVLFAEQRYLRSVVDREWQVMREGRRMDPGTERLFAALLTAIAELDLPATVDEGKKPELLSLMAEAHQQRELRVFQAGNGMPVALWIVLIAMTTVLTLFVSFCAIDHPALSVLMVVVFVASVAGILVIAQLLDYPFEGGLALPPGRFADVAAKVSVLLDAAR